jgi:hypothetical protein
MGPAMPPLILSRVISVISDCYFTRGIKRAPKSADNPCVGRAFSFVALLVLLGACGAALYTHIHSTGFSTFVHRLGINASGKQAAEDELLGAGTQLQSDHQAYATFRRSNLSHFGGMSFGYATDTGYCIQVTKAGKWYHMTGPGGYPLDGAC